ncbi:MAG: ribonuclease [Pseudomonadota bacterium]
MAEWLIERGIGEDRAILIDNGEVRAAKLHWTGELVCGEIRTARLVAKRGSTRRGTATLEDGAEVLVDHLPRDLTEGASFALRISRAPISERGRLKRAQGRFFAIELPREQAAQEAGPFGLSDFRIVRQFPAGLWEDVWSSASSASLEFTGGEILCSVTPAMTLIDIDCDRPEDACTKAIPTIERAIRWFDLGGNIGIDFPSVSDKGTRKDIDSDLGKALGDWPHERTAMNGFGFVQLVARLEGPSLLHRFATSRVGMCARAALRRAEQVEGHGAILLTVHPAINAKLKPEWLDELQRRTGKDLRIAVDPGLALEAAHAQTVGA